MKKHSFVNRRRSPLRTRPTAWGHARTERELPRFADGFAHRTEQRRALQDGDEARTTAPGASLLAAVASSRRLREIPSLFRAGQVVVARHRDRTR